VWLASVSRTSPSGKLLAAWTWGEGTKRAAARLLESALAGVGDASRERLFRMPITMCRHRALTQAEHDGLPRWWHDAPAMDLAGPPEEVLWTRGIPEIPSTMPCLDPGRRQLDARRTELYAIVPCGTCATCAARAARETN
jgi:hypothetical protein